VLIVSILLDLQILAFFRSVERGKGLGVSRQLAVGSCKSAVVRGKGGSRKGLSGVNTQISDVIPAIDPLSEEFLSVPIGGEDDPECTPNPN